MIKIILDFVPFLFCVFLFFTFIVLLFIFLIHRVDNYNQEIINITKAIINCPKNYDYYNAIIVAYSHTHISHDERSHRIYKRFENDDSVKTNVKDYYLNYIGDYRFNVEYELYDKEWNKIEGMDVVRGNSIYVGQLNDNIIPIGTKTKIYYCKNPNVKVFPLEMLKYRCASDGYEHYLEKIKLLL